MIHDFNDLCNAWQRIDELWRAIEGSPEAFELDVLVDMAEDFEDRHLDDTSALPSPVAVACNALCDARINQVGYCIWAICPKETM